MEQFVWMRRFASQLSGDNQALCALLSEVEDRVELYDSGNNSKRGRIVFEIGAALRNAPDWQQGTMYDDSVAACDYSIVACKRAVKLYKQWCAEASRAVMCWLWLARKEGVAKDIRVVIADLIWEQRAAWSE